MRGKKKRKNILWGKRSRKRWKKSIHEEPKRHETKSSFLARVTHTESRFVGRRPAERGLQRRDLRWCCRRWCRGCKEICLCTKRQIRDESTDARDLLSNEFSLILLQVISSSLTLLSALYSLLFPAEEESSFAFWWRMKIVMSSHMHIMYKRIYSFTRVSLNNNCSLKIMNTFVLMNMKRSTLRGICLQKNTPMNDIEFVSRESKGNQGESNTWHVSWTRLFLSRTKSSCLSLTPLFLSAIDVLVISCLSSTLLNAVSIVIPFFSTRWFGCDSFFFMSLSPSIWMPKEEEVKTEDVASSDI